MDAGMFGGHGSMVTPAPAGVTRSSLSLTGAAVRGRRTAGSRMQGSLCIAAGGASLRLGAPLPRPPAFLSSSASRHCRSTVASSCADASFPSRPLPLPASESPHCILNFYHLTPLAAPLVEVEEQRIFLASLGDGVRGRIYVSAQGINAQCGGETAACRAYVSWLARRPGFDGLSYCLDPCEGHAFPKLRLKMRPNLISLQGGMAAQPVTDPSQRATPLSPRDWEVALRARAEQAEARSSGGGCSSEQPLPVVLDVRNGYEWDAGHFVGAERPAEEMFRETPVFKEAPPTGPENRRLLKEEEEAPSPQQDQQPVKLPQALETYPRDAPVYMYCTGGIRCDVYSTHLRQAGFSQLYTLEGGVQAFLKEAAGLQARERAGAEGGEEEAGSIDALKAALSSEPPRCSSQESPSASHALQATSPPPPPPSDAMGELWKGSLYVFDGRMAIRPGRATEELEAAVACQMCGGRASLPHANCANVDCNKLFIACGACHARQRGCCAPECLDAPRLLRPPKLQGQYGNWASYADPGSSIMAPGRSGRRAARRVQRVARLRERQELKRAEKKERAQLLHGVHVSLQPEGEAWQRAQAAARKREQLLALRAGE